MTVFKEAQCCEDIRCKYKFVWIQRFVSSIFIRKQLLIIDFKFRKNQQTLKSGSKKKKPKVRSEWSDWTSIFIILGIAAIALTIYFGYRASLSERKLFSVSLIALFGGLLYEIFRVSKSWENIVPVFLGSYFFSLIAFSPGKREYVYVLENHIQNWPYLFILFFAIIYAAFYKDTLTTRLTEGMTLLLSISLIYWFIDYGFSNYHNWIAITLMSLAFLLSTFSIINAFTTIKLTKSNRLTLSIWSSIVMFAFAIDNVIRVFNNQDIETTKYLSQQIYIGLQYFLLGVSAIYIVRNYVLLEAFIPNRNGDYINDVKENIKDHIERYSDKQVNVWDSVFCVLYAGTIYVLNYNHHFLPRHTMIWLVFVTFPLILELKSLIHRGKKPQLTNTNGSVQSPG